MFPNEKFLGWNEPTPNDGLDIGICVFFNGNTLNGLEGTLDNMDMVGKIGCDIAFPIHVLDKMGILIVKCPILLYENRMHELDPPIGVDVKGVDTVIVWVGIKQAWRDKIVLETGGCEFPDTTVDTGTPIAPTFMVLEDNSYFPTN